MNHCNQLGQSIRQRYFDDGSDFQIFNITKRFFSLEHKFTSTAVHRTIISCQSMSTGLFPQTGPDFAGGPALPNKCLSISSSFLFVFQILTNLCSWSTSNSHCWCNKRCEFGICQDLQHSQRQYQKKTRFCRMESFGNKIYCNRARSCQANRFRCISYQFSKLWTSFIAFFELKTLKTTQKLLFSCFFSSK